MSLERTPKAAYVQRAISRWRQTYRGLVAPYRAPQDAQTAWFDILEEERTNRYRLRNTKGGGFNVATD